MEISKKLLYKYLHFLAIDQLAEEYKTKGYEVNREVSLGNYEADLIAIKGDEKIVIEVKAGQMNSAKKEKLAQLADYVNSLGGYKFKVVIASPPKEKKIRIDNLDKLIFDYTINNLPSELDELSTHTTVESVTDLEIHDLQVQKSNEIIVQGQGIIEVRIQFGSDGDETRGDGHYQYESFPFDFELSLSYNSKGQLEINEGSVVEVNTDSFYE